MVALTLVANAARAVPTRQSAKSAAKAHAVGATPAFVARRRGDAGVAVSARSRKASHRLVIARAGGEVRVKSQRPTHGRRRVVRISAYPVCFALQGLGRARDARFAHTRHRFAPAPSSHPRTLPPHAALDEQGDELDDEENNRRTAEAEVEVVEDEDDEEEEEEAAPPTRVSEIMAQLQEAVDAGTGGDVLAELLPELTTEVSGIESAFKDIQAANVGLEDQAAAVKDQFLRLTADFDNFKKRTVKEKQQLGETTKSKVFEAMLPALDNFDLAKANLKPESEEGEKIMSQYQGLYEGPMTILSNQGLTAVDGVGAPFDPNFHEAIMREESEEPEDVIIEEFRTGYKMGEDTLVRASMVKVSAGPASE